MLVLITLLFTYQAMAGPIEEVPDVLKYFPETQDDLSKITWAHAVNTETELLDVLKDDKIMMIEADVRMGIVNNTPDRVPVMKHNEETIPDISLESFVIKIINANKRKGLKLDFKETEALEKSVKLLNSINISFPLWINADIAKGPGGDDPNVTLTKDLVKFTNGVAFSFGWTTGKPEKKLEYTTDMFTDLNKKLAALDIACRNITYPVRAVSAAISGDVMQSLLDGEKWTLTIWSGKDDTEYVDANKLKYLIDTNKTKVFVDVPEDLLVKLHNVK